MDDDARKQRAPALADEAGRREAHEAGAFAAEAVHQDYGNDFIGARDPTQVAYDEAWIANYNELREFFEGATLALFTAYDTQKHPPRSRPRRSLTPRSTHWPRNIRRSTR